MKVKNPNYVSPVEAWVNQNRAAIEVYLASKEGLEYIDFAVVRSDNPTVKDPVTGGAMTDGTLAEIFKSLGLEVVE